MADEMRPCCREYLDHRLHAMHELFSARMESADRAITLERENLNTRLEHSNGLIGQMRQQAQDMVRVGDLSALEFRVRKLEAFQSDHQGATKGSQALINIGMLVLAAAIAAGVAMVTK